MPGTIVELNAMDALGWIELDAGGRVRFGGAACDRQSFTELPGLGTRVRVIGTQPGFRGAVKAIRVVPIDFVEAPPLDPRAVLAALKLPVSLARKSWEATLDGLVESFAIGKAECLRDQVFATISHDKASALLAQWLGEPSGSVGHFADVLLIRDRHGVGPVDRRQLYQLEVEGSRKSLFLLRTEEDRDAVRALGIILCTLTSPDTEAALSGIFRYEGATPAFRAHAPTCSTCQANLRSTLRKYGRDTLTADFLELLRPTDPAE